MSGRIEFLTWDYRGLIDADDVQRALGATTGRPVFLMKVRHAYAIALSEEMLSEAEATAAYEATHYRND